MISEGMSIRFGGLDGNDGISSRVNKSFLYVLFVFNARLVLRLQVHVQPQSALGLILIMRLQWVLVEKMFSGVCSPVSFC